MEERIYKLRLLNDNVNVRPIDLDMGLEEALRVIDALLLMLNQPESVTLQ